MLCIHALKTLYQLVNSNRKRYMATMWKVNDNRLTIFINICQQVASERSYLNKAQILRNFFKNGSKNDGFQGDLKLWVRMLIPSDSPRVYNLQNKQMLKLFSRLFNTDAAEMQQDLELGGDVSETICKYFKMSAKLKPQPESILYLQDVDAFLEELSKHTKEMEQTDCLRRLCQQTNAEDLKMIIRIIRQDLKMNAKASHILAAFGPMAYQAYQSRRDLESVIESVAQKSLNLDDKNQKYTNKRFKKTEVDQVQVMTPIAPMLANVCSSLDNAFKKCPNGLFCEIKYDGERVQIHKSGNQFKFFSRNLKPVMEHKVKRVKEYLPKAFPNAGDMILDSEIILVDVVSGELLPFGSLGTHKKKEYPNAAVCVFIFDCLLFDGYDLTNLSLSQRRQILEENIKPIKSYVQLSESHFLNNQRELSLMVASALKAHLEGVVLKDPMGVYQPGKRGWIKVKKDYLFDGKMADTVDLVVLGASYGSGKQGSVLSIFLMGCYDQHDHLWKTVTKVHTGLDDHTRLKMHDNLMQLMDRTNLNKLPTWLLCKKSLIPDFVAKNPLQMPVWEITGAEFSKSMEHTASGISIRFPRITRLRSDKSAHQSTDLNQLEHIYEGSKSNVNVALLFQNDNCMAEDKININSKLCADPIKTDNLKRKLNSHINTKTGHNRSSDSDDSFDLNTHNSQTKSNKCLKMDTIKSAKLASYSEQATTSSKCRATSSVSNTVLKKSNLFGNILACFDDTAICKEIISTFKTNGGIVTNNTKLAEIKFYSTTKDSIDLQECRRNFQPTCRHLDVKWISDSIQHKKLKSYSIYAVIL